MTEKINVTIDSDGGLDVTGARGVEVGVATRHKKNGTLQVRYDATPVGDDALYAGSVKVIVSITPPEFVTNGGDTAAKQAMIGGKYARQMIDALIETIPRTLNGAVAESCKDALGGEEAIKDMQGMLDVAMAIAHDLLAEHGSVSEAIKHADPRSNPDIAPTAGDDPLILSLMHGVLVEAIKAHG